MPDTTVVDEHGVPRHQLSWADFDALARGGGGSSVIRQLRRAERSRRLLLLRGLVDRATKEPELVGPLPAPDRAWDLLERVERGAPGALDLVLAHPYTGTWLGYVTRLLRNRTDGVCPLWMHVGHVHALAAAAGIHAGLGFDASIPLWRGNAMLPTLGLARFTAAAAWSVARVRARPGHAVVAAAGHLVRIPDPPWSDAPGWWGLRRVGLSAGGHALELRLDDLDPYRGLVEPVLPDRLGGAVVDEWHALLDRAWRLLGAHLPDTADAMAAGLESLVPEPHVPFRTASGSSEEAFGSAVVARPADATALAATLVHEFQHVRLGGLMHIAPLYVADDPTERWYAPWRDDPRPFAGVMQGAYAYFGVTRFWRALATAEGGTTRPRALFEFAHWRGPTARTVRALRGEPALTEAGQRFLADMAEPLDAWRTDPVPADLAAAAAMVAEDHHAGWRLRHVRPDADAVAVLADRWTAGLPPRPVTPLAAGAAATPVPDGPWSRARADLVRLDLTDPAGSRPAEPGRHGLLSADWSAVPDATAADFALVSGRYLDAVRGYRAELAAGPDRPASWIGLGLAQSRLAPGPAARTLLGHPELVRAVYRRVRAGAGRVPAPDALAAWIGRSGR